MKHYGAEPPWAGRSEFGSWRRGLELWDGSVEWTYVPPFARPTATLSILTDILHSVYMPMVVEQMNSSLLAGQMVDVMRADGTLVTSGRVAYDDQATHLAAHRAARTAFPDPEDDDDWGDH